ncbi:MAG: hypothetical protein ACMUHM_06640 [Thermoplasmatota archaeon]
MDIVKEVSEGLGLQTAYISIEVTTSPVLLGEEFDLVVTIRAGPKGLKCNSLDIGLFWWYLEKEFNPYKGQADYVSRVPVLIHEMRTEAPFEVPPDEERYYNLRSFADPDFKYSHKRFGWFFKIHADIPWAPDERQEIPLDVLPRLELSAPVLALMKNLGYLEDTGRRNGDDRYCRYRLLPPPHMSHYMKFMDLEVEDMLDGTVEIQMELELIYDREEFDWISEETRTVMRRVFINKGEFRKAGGERYLDPVTRLLKETIWMTINQFMEDPYIPSFQEPFRR